MTKKNIIIVSYSFPPSNAPAAQRPYALAKYLDSDKFNKTVITCSNTDSSLGFDSNFDENLNNVNLFKIKSKVGRTVSTLRNGKMADKKKSISSSIKAFFFNLLSSLVVPDKAIFWVPNVIKFLKNNPQLVESCDLIYSTSPAFSNHLIARFIKKKNKNVKWIADLRDFHYLESQSEKNNLKSNINKRLEKSVLKKADKIVFISKSMLDVYANHYTEFASKMNVVYNGFDLDDQKETFEKLNNESLTIFYAGSFYRGVRSPIPLLKILDALILSGKIQIHDVSIQIAGNFEQDLIDEAKNFNSFKSIVFLGKISRSDVLQKLKKSDLLWLIIGEKPAHYCGVPIKFFEYIGARRPIINFAPSKSEPTRIIKNYNLGWNFDLDNFDLQDCIQKFNEIIIQKKCGDLNNPVESRKFPEFNRKDQASVFEQIFES